MRLIDLREPTVEPTPEAEAKPEPGSQEWYRRLPEPVDKPDTIDMRSMGMSVPKPRPPRRPSWEV